jgi:hypothetical protein
MSDRPPAWMGWEQLARHSGLSVDTLRRVALEPGFPPVVHASPRRPRINVTSFDQWLQGRGRATAHAGVDAVLAEIRARKGA